VRRVAGQIEVVVGKPMSYWITSLGETVGLTHCADMAWSSINRRPAVSGLTIDFEQIKFLNFVLGGRLMPFREPDTRSLPAARHA